MATRLASDKSIKDLSDTFKSLFHELLTKVDSQATRIKQLEILVTEGHEAGRKDIKKLRDELEEMEPADGGGAFDSDEPPKWVTEIIGQVKDLGKLVLGDDATVEVIRKKARAFIGGKGKKALAGGDDDEE